MRGQITDANGADVSITNLETNQKQSAASDSEGFYRFAFVAVGNYELKAGQTGFESSNQRFTATVGQALKIPLELAVSGAAARVAVHPTRLSSKPHERKLRKPFCPKMSRICL